LEIRSRKILLTSHFELINRQTQAYGLVNTLCNSREAIPLTLTSTQNGDEFDCGNSACHTQPKWNPSQLNRTDTKNGRIVHTSQYSN